MTNEIQTLTVTVEGKEYTIVIAPKEGGVNVQVEEKKQTLPYWVIEQIRPDMTVADRKHFKTESLARREMKHMESSLKVHLFLFQIELPAALFEASGWAAADRRRMAAEDILRDTSPEPIASSHVGTRPKEGTTVMILGAQGVIEAVADLADRWVVTIRWHGDRRNNITHWFPGAKNIIR